MSTLPKLKPKELSKGSFLRNLQSLHPAKQGWLRHCFENVSAAIQNFLVGGGGGEHVGGGVSGGGGVQRA